MESNHILYAVLDTIHGPHRVRLSRPLPWGIAVDMHEALHGRTRRSYERPVVNPGYTVYGRPVRYFAVRHANDPKWPATKPILRLTDTNAA